MLVKTAAMAAFVFLMAIGTARADGVDSYSVPASCDGEQWTSDRALGLACETSRRYRTPLVFAYQAVAYADLELTARYCGFKLTPVFRRGKAGALGAGVDREMYRSLIDSMAGEFFAARAGQDKVVYCAGKYSTHGPDYSWRPDAAMIMFR